MFVLPGPNVVSISFSPLGRYVVVGFAAKRRSTWIMLTKQVNLCFCYITYVKSVTDML